MSNLDHYIIASANLDDDQTLPQKMERDSTPTRHIHIVPGADSEACVEK